MKKKIKNKMKMKRRNMKKLIIIKTMMMKIKKMKIIKISTIMIMKHEMTTIKMMRRETKGSWTKTRWVRREEEKKKKKRKKEKIKKMIMLNKIYKRGNKLNKNLKKCIQLHRKSSN